MGKHYFSGRSGDVLTSERDQRMLRGSKKEMARPGPYESSIPDHARPGLGSWLTEQHGASTPQCGRSGPRIEAVRAGAYLAPG